MFVEEDPIKSSYSRKRVCSNVGIPSTPRSPLSRASSIESPENYGGNTRGDLTTNSSSCGQDSKKKSSASPILPSAYLQHHLSLYSSVSSSASNSDYSLPIEEKQFNDDDEVAKSIMIESKSLGSLNCKEYIPDFLGVDAPFSTFLRSGVKYTGYQRYKNLKFKVDVQFQYSDLNNDMIYGYLTIENLTKENSTITTYFESEIIGENHDFFSRINTDSLFINDKVDIYNWRKFPSFQKDLYSKVLKHIKNPSNFGQYKYRDCLNQRFVYMRWKEKYLVPDPFMQLKNASFNGIYYIRLDQLTGNITGFYYYNNYYNDIDDIDDFGIRKEEAGKPSADQVLNLQFIPDLGISQSFQFA